MTMYVLVRGEYSEIDIYGVYDEIEMQKVKAKIIADQREIYNKTKDLRIIDLEGRAIKYKSKSLEKVREAERLLEEEKLLEKGTAEYRSTNNKRRSILKEAERLNFESKIAKDEANKKKKLEPSEDSLFNLSNYSFIECCLNAPPVPSYFIPEEE